MGFKGTLETERAIGQTVDTLLTCPKSREENLIRKLRSLWNRRLVEIAKRHLTCTPSTQPTGFGQATEVSTLVPTELATVTTSTAAVRNHVVSETISPCGAKNDEEETPAQDV